MLSALHGNSGLPVLEKFHVGYAYRRVTSDIYQPTRHTQPPPFAPSANGINYASLFIVGLIFRTFLFIYSFQQCFYFICSTCLLLTRVAGWVGLMSAWRGAERSGRTLRKSGQSLDEQSSRGGPLTNIMAEVSPIEAEPLSLPDV